MSAADFLALGREAESECSVEDDDKQGCHDAQVCGRHAAIAAALRETWNAALDAAARAVETRNRAIFDEGARTMPLTAEVILALKLPETREGK